MVKRRPSPARNVPDQWLRAILRSVYQRPAVTRDDIIRDTGLNAASVSLALQYLINAGRIQSAGQVPSSAGRRADLLSLNQESAYFIAVDLEAPVITFAFTNLVGDIRYRWEQPLESRQDLDAKTLLRGFEAVQCNLTQGQRSRLMGVGVSYPGVIDAKGGVTAVNLGWNRFPLRERLLEATSLPCVVETSCRSYMLAERWFGSALNCNDCAYIEVGRGIGAAVIAGGSFVEGQNRMAGEFGHITIDPGAIEECRCGKRGCLESIASGPSMVRQYQRNSGNGEGTATVNAVFAKARGHDRNALQVVQRSATAIGVGLSHLTILFNPSRIILGGELIHGEDLLLGGIRQTLERHLTAFFETPEIVVTRLGSDIGLKGAAALAFGHALETPELLAKLCSPVSDGAKV